MADFGVGTRGTLRITDDGSVVRFYVLCSDPATRVGEYKWNGVVNGVGVGGQVSLGAGFGSRELGAWGVGYSQNVSIGQQATNTQGLGGAYNSPPVYIGRATVPQPPTGVSVDQATATSLRYIFSGNGNGGAAIQEWQIGYGTNSGSPQYFVGSSGTSTVGGLAEHTTWYFWSRGRNAVGWSGWSNRLQGNTPGHPTAPLTPSTTPSTGVTGRIAFQWTAPATTGAGGIVGYNIFRDGVQIATTTGTGTSYVDNGLTPYTTYSYKVAARNAYSNSVSGTGPQSAAATVVAPGPPSAPQNLSGVSSSTVPGEVQLTWQAPVNAGTGGITGYTIRLADDTPVGTTTGTGLTYTASGLTPGVAYTFKVAARNSLADVEGSVSAWSNQVTVTPIGEPGMPTFIQISRSSTVSNRLVLSWGAPPGTLSGYSIFIQRNGTGPYTLLQQVNATHTVYNYDWAGADSTYSFHVRARTIYTDTLAPGYPGNWGGPATGNVMLTGSSDNTQYLPVALSAVTNLTNAVFNGTYIINQVTATTIRYSKTAANIPSAASGGSITNITNALFNGSFTITGAATPTTVTYAKTNANVLPLATSGGVVTDTTNTAFNGTFVVTAVNVGANTLSYNNTGATLAARAVPPNVAPGQFGKITNLSNAIFNGTGKIITAITEYTLSYTQTNADVAESNAAGVVVNATNRDVFNGTYIVAAVPAFNVVQYAKTAANIAKRTWLNPNGIVFRGISPSTLDVRFRSGWAG